MGERAGKVRVASGFQDTQEFGRSCASDGMLVIHWRRTGLEVGSSGIDTEPLIAPQTIQSEAVMSCPTR